MSSVQPSLERTSSGLFLQALLDETESLMRQAMEGQSSFKVPIIQSDPIDILHNPPDAEVDIVAVHGLGSSVETTWTHKGSGVHWLRDLLPLDIPKARIMTFRHNSCWSSDALTNDLVGYGRTLLMSVERFRDEDETMNRPIIFVGHSFGGLVIQQALVLAKEPAVNSVSRKKHDNLANSVAGVIFLGTPHTGSAYSAYGKIYCILNYWGGANSLLLGYMDRGSQKTKELEREFQKKYPTQSFDFWETIPNMTFGMPSQAVVTQESGTRCGQDAGPLNANHFNMNKFENRNDASYVAVRDKIVGVVESWTERLNENPDETSADQRHTQYYITVSSEERV